jgi:hypothetical protein
VVKVQANRPYMTVLGNPLGALNAALPALYLVSVSFVSGPGLERWGRRSSSPGESLQLYGCRPLNPSTPQPFTPLGGSPWSKHGTPQVWHSPVVVIIFSREALGVRDATSSPARDARLHFPIANEWYLTSTARGTSNPSPCMRMRADRPTRFRARQVQKCMEQVTLK